MHIGFDASRINSTQRTGTENYSYELLKQLISLDQVNIYSLYSRFHLPAELTRPPQITNQVLAWPRLWTQAGLALHLLKHQPDVLFVPAHTLPVLHRPSLKSVVTIHDLGAEYLPQYHTFPGKLYLNRSTDYAVHHATQLIAVSNFTKQDLIARYGISASQISVIHEGVDLANLTPASPEEIAQVKQVYQLSQPYIVFVGTIQPRKNLLRLIQAISLLKDKSINLVLAGKNGWLSDEIYQAPAKYGLTDRVKFLGYLDNQYKAALYSGAVCSTLPSLFEGFGLPILESMACGTPVVASQATSLPEVVGEAGLLVDPHDPQSIAGGLDQLISNPDLRQDLRQKGFLQVKKFSWEKAARQTLKVLQEAANA